MDPLLGGVGESFPEGFLGEGTGEIWVSIRVPFEEPEAGGEGGLDEEGLGEGVLREFGEVLL